MSFGVEDVKFVMNLWVLCSQPVHKELWGVACMQHKTFSSSTWLWGGLVTALICSTTSWCWLSLEPDLGRAKQALYLEFESVFWPVISVWSCKRICLYTCHKFCSTQTGLVASHWTYTAMLVPKAVRYLDFFFLLRVNLDVCSSVCLISMNLLLD